MEANTTTRFELADWTVEPALNRLERGERVVTVEPKVMDLLVFLARNAGETVSKEQLLEHVWGGAYVVEGVIFKTLSTLREALEDDAREPRYVLTVRRRGYRLVAPVRWWADAPPTELVPPDLTVPVASPPSSHPSPRALLVALAVSLIAVVGLLGWVRTRSVSGALPPRETFERIAVVAFEDFSGDRERAYLARSLHDEIVDRLARLGRPRVVLVPGAEEAPGDPLARARSARADALLSGRIESEAGRLRASLRLVSLESGEVLWTQSYEREPEAVAVLARAVVRDLAGTLAASEDAAKAAQPVAASQVDPQAYQDALKARWLWSQRGTDDLRRALALFERAVQRDPSYANAFAGLALARATAGSYHVQPPAAAWQQARAEARRALELDPNCIDALVALGHLQLVADWDLDGSIATLRRAVALAPGPSTGRQFLAEAYSAADRHDEALATIEDALALEPYSPLLLAVKALVLNAAGKPEEVLRTLEEADLFHPRFVWQRFYRANALERLGRPSEAALARTEPVCTTCAPDSLPRRSREAAEREGLAGFYRVELEIWQRPPSSRNIGAPTLLAEALAGLGRSEEAWPWLEKAVANRGEYFLHLRRSPAFDKLRGDPRWKALLERAGLP